MNTLTTTKHFRLHLTWHTFPYPGGCPQSFGCIKSSDRLHVSLGKGKSNIDASRWVPALETLESSISTHYAMLASILNKLIYNLLRTQIYIYIYNSLLPSWGNISNSLLASWENTCNSLLLSWGNICKSLLPSWGNTCNSILPSWGKHVQLVIAISRKHATHYCHLDNNAVRLILFLVNDFKLFSR